MRAATKRLWANQDQHRGDRERLFRAVADATGGSRVLTVARLAEQLAESHSVAWT